MLYIHSLYSSMICHLREIDIQDSHLNEHEIYTITQ